MKNNDPIGNLLVSLIKGIGQMLKFTFNLIKKGVLRLFGKRTVSEKQQKQLQTEFEKIAHKDRAGNYPLLIRYKYDKSKPAHEYIFKSSIPLEEWENSKQSLNTALDKNIHSIDEFGSKQKIRIVATDLSVRLPERLTFELDQVVKDDTTFIAGQNLMKQDITFNILKSPHLLVAGGTGSGKSVFLQCIVGQALLKGWQLNFIDFKNVEFNSDFKRYGKVASDYLPASIILQEAFEENDLRMKLFERARVRNISEYNEKFPNEPLSYTAVVIDEIAELLSVSKGMDKEVTSAVNSSINYLESLARLGRAQGVFLFMAMQRPEAKLLNGQIRDQLNVRASGYFPNPQAYRMVLGDEGAFIRQRSFLKSTLLNNGDFKNKNDNEIVLDDKAIVPGRFGFLAGSIPQLIQAYNYNPEWLHGYDITVKGRMLNGTSSMNEKTVAKPITVPVDAVSKKIIEENDHGTDKEESDEILDFNFDD